MVGLLILLVMGFQWALKKIGTGIGRWAFLLMGSVLAFFYYLFVAWLVYVQLAQLLIRLLKSTLINAPGWPT